MKFSGVTILQGVEFSIFLLNGNGAVIFVIFILLFYISGLGPYLRPFGGGGARLNSM